MEVGPSVRGGVNGVSVRCVECDLIRLGIVELSVG